MKKENNAQMSASDLRRVTMEEFSAKPDRFQLRKGSDEGAPNCPYGNQFEWIGYDLEREEYVRFTKSVFKLLVNA